MKFFLLIIQTHFTALFSQRRGQFEEKWPLFLQFLCFLFLLIIHYKNCGFSPQGTYFLFLPTIWKIMLSLPQEVGYNKHPCHPQRCLYGTTQGSKEKYCHSYHCLCLYDGDQKWKTHGAARDIKPDLYSWWKLTHYNPGPFEVLRKLTLAMETDLISGVQSKLFPLIENQSVKYLFAFQWKWQRLNQSSFWPPFVNFWWPQRLFF